MNPWINQDECEYTQLDNVTGGSLTGCFHITDFGVWCLSKACPNIQIVCEKGLHTRHILGGGYTLDIFWGEVTH